MISRLDPSIACADLTDETTQRNPADRVDVPASPMRPASKPREAVLADARALLVATFATLPLFSTAASAAAQGPQESPAGGASDAASGASHTGPLLVLREAVGLGYGRYAFTSNPFTSDGHPPNRGGGLAFPLTLDVYWRLPSHYYVGTSLAFHPILGARGEDEWGNEWKIPFTPGGYLGAIGGYDFGDLALDVTLGFGGGGNSQVGGFAPFVLVPKVTYSITSYGRLRLGAYFGVLIAPVLDVAHGRTLTWFDASVGVAMTFE